MRVTLPTLNQLLSSTFVALFWVGTPLFCAPPKLCRTALSSLGDHSPLLKRLGISRLSDFDTNPHPWRHLEWEQQHYYIGSTPRELALGLPPKEKAELPARLKTQAEKETARLLKKLQLESAEFEMWPSFDGWGSKTWAFARYRESPLHEWKWLDSSFEDPNQGKGPGDPTTVLFPSLLDPRSKQGKERLFNENSSDLYQLPEFATALWISKDKKTLIDAWLAPEERKSREHDLLRTGAMAVLLPPPARFNGRSKTFTVRAEHGKTEFPPEISWMNEDRTSPRLPGELPPLRVNFGEDFNEQYFQDLRRFSGELPIHDPQTGKIIDFGKMGSGQEDNQILNLIAYLKEDYQSWAKAAGLAPARFELEEQRFEWRGIPQANLIFKIKGRLPRGKNKPIVLTDHIDKAVAEDIFDSSGKRVTNPGANDNGTAMATLRRAGKLFIDRYKDNPPEHDIWIVHLTGEEYPGSSLGARYFVSDLLQKGQDIGVDINLDMLGHHTPGDKVYQISPGEDSPASKQAALTALAVGKTVSSEWQPTLRFPWGRSSYIQQTDATIFDRAGFPTVFINEHINLRRRVNPHYHQSHDLPKNIDLDYAATQAKTAIETAARLAEMPG